MFQKSQVAKENCFCFTVVIFVVTLEHFFFVVTTFGTFQKFQVPKFAPNPNTNKGHMFSGNFYDMLPSIINISEQIVPFLSPVVTQI